MGMVRRKADVKIERGENRGRTVTYTNVVRELTPVGMWNGTAMTVRIERETVTQPGSDSYAVLLQNGKGGPIIGASQLIR